MLVKKLLHKSNSIVEIHQSLYMPETLLLNWEQFKHLIIWKTHWFLKKDDSPA